MNGDSVVIFGVAFFFLITGLILASMCCTCTSVTLTGSPQLPRILPASSSVVEPADACRCVEPGIDEATINGYPTLIYSQADDLEKGLKSTCCSICLVEYNGSDVLRVLPDCNHYFHVNCIDPWLRLHPTCPICRTSPLPTPVSTPLSTVVAPN